MINCIASIALSLSAEFVKYRETEDGKQGYGILTTHPEQAEDMALNYGIDDGYIIPMKGKFLIYWFPK